MSEDISKDMKYRVTYTAISVGSLDVEADSMEEALSLAKGMAVEAVEDTPTAGMDVGLWILKSPDDAPPTS